MRPVRRLCRHRSVRAEEIHGGLSAHVGRHERPFSCKIKLSKKFRVFQKTRNEIRALDGQQDKGSIPSCAGYSPITPPGNAGRGFSRFPRCYHLEKYQRNRRLEAGFP